MRLDMLLKDKVALISGGSRGIGRAISELFYEQGATVIIMSRNLEKLKQTAAEIDKNGEGRCIPVQGDVGSKESVDAAMAEIKSKYCIDILVNCAGINLRGPLETMPYETWQKVIDVNLTGAFLLTQHCFEMMKKKGGGKIVNIASLMSEIARPTISPYVASKGGIKMFTKAIAIDWAKYNIQANAVIPGYISTEMNTPLIEDPKFNQFIIDRTPAGRWGKPEEVAQAVLFFASPCADFITGQLVAVDGGILAAL